MIDTMMKTNDRPRVSLSLPGDLEILVTRDFRARRTTVFDAWSKPEFVRRWYGCERQTVVECTLDFRVGGRWRWVFHDPVDGEDHALSGEYLEIARPERIVYTEVYEPVPGSDHHVEISLAEHAGVTTLRMLIRHPSQFNRDMHLKTGMEAGMQQAMDRLEAVLATIEAA